MAPPVAHAREPHLWATVNICDSPTARNVVGIRASMPGNGTDQRMFMHFSAQWYSPAKKRWQATGSSSPWVRVGSARYVSTQRGYSFQFADPPRGTQFVMRGVVRYQWRSRRTGRVLKRRTRRTTAGIEGVVGGIPARKSAAACRIAF
ncbi:MAG TPA: hypothetical protein VGV10_03780 [Thermoleophilaceae bacterium]|nr:hypothetical protein [Thermoleophilaceae bacterium]